MPTVEHHCKLDELNYLPNDHYVQMQFDWIWSLLADLCKPEIGILGHAAEPMETAPPASTPL